MHIMGKMLEVIDAPRKHVSQFAPKVQMVQVPTEQTGEVIGPRGKVIRNIIAQTQATVDIDDNGVVTISAADESAVARAVEWIQGLVKEVVAGEEYDGEVKRLMPFGAFVEIIPGKEGLVHVSQMSTEFVKDPSDIVKVGDKVRVRVSEIDSQGRLNLSMLFGEDAKARPERPRFEKREYGQSSGGGDRRPPFRPRRRF